MIISRTPFRVSFFGGGTDYPSWYLRHGGSVLAATIDKYCYLTCRHLPPFFEHRYRVVYSKVETVSRVEEIVHPSVRETLLHLGVSRGVEIHHDGDLPARSGMGSSSAFTVGLLHVLHSLGGRMVSRHQLATEAIHIEQGRLQETVGSQDQVMAAYGGLNHVRFLPGGEIVVRPVVAPRERVAEFNAHLMLFYTGIKRTASDVAGSYARDLDARGDQLRSMSALVDEGLSALCGGGDLLAFGALLHEAWLAKRGFSPMVSNPHVDAIYEQALAAGAVGGKLLGAGGGGFFLLFVPPDRQADVAARLGRFLRVPFRFEYNGSQIAFYDQEADYSREDRARFGGRIDSFRELTDTPPTPLTRSAGALEPDVTIYVAGGDTLIGSALVRRLRRGGWSRLAGADGGAPDLTDAAAVDAFFREARPEYVFHAGGRSGGIAANVRHPADLMVDNLLAAAHVVRAAHDHGARKLLYLASSCGYPRLSPQPMAEGQLLAGPPEPTSEAYALAKLAGWKLCQAYRRQYGDDFIVGFPANAYGAGDDFSPEGGHVVPALIRRAHEARQRGAPSLTVWGTGTPRREFVHADDLADACLFVMENYSDEAPVNLGGGGEVSVRELAEAVCRVVGFTGRLEFDATRPDGAPRKALDAGRLAALGWRPGVSLDAGLAATYRSFLGVDGRREIEVGA